MGLEDNKALVRRLNDEFWNQGRAAVIDEAFAPDFVTHNPLPGQPPGREGQKQTITAVRAALPDIRSTIDDLIAEGDKVVWRWTARATHQGPLMGIPPTGKQITFGGIVIDRIASGQIVERWDQTDTLGLLQQLGAIPS